VIRVGFIGCGFIAGLHLDAYARLAAAGRSVAVVAAADAAPGRAAGVARVHGIPASATDYRAVLDDPAVDAVDICTPNRSHREIAVAAAQAGKHVFLEKPIALTLEDADAIIAACGDAGVKLMVGQSQRFEAIHRELHALVRSGEIGAPRHLTTFTCEGYFWPGGWRAWQHDPRQSAGNLVHNGIHDLDLMTWIVGEAPISLYARGVKLGSPELDTFDSYQIALSFPSGVTTLSVLGYSAVPPGGLLRSVLAIGSKGEARYETLADGAWWQAAGADHSVLPGPWLYDGELGHWLDCLEQDADPLVTPAQVRRSLELALAAERSAQTRSVITFAEAAHA
jgi:predicted dehydrogenase